MKEFEIKREEDEEINMPEEMVMLGYFRFQTVATEQTLSLMVVMSDKVSSVGYWGRDRFSSSSRGRVLMA